MPKKKFPMKLKDFKKEADIFQNLIWRYWQSCWDCGIEDTYKDHALIYEYYQGDSMRSPMEFYLDHNDREVMGPLRFRDHEHYEYFLSLPKVKENLRRFFRI